MYQHLYCTSIILFLNIQSSLVQKLLHGPYQTPIYEICSSFVYCQGDLLDLVQLSKIHASSKVFVNLQMKRNETDILIDFRKMKSDYNATNTTIPPQVLRKFVYLNFRNDKLDQWMPPDFKDYLPIFDYLQDSTYKEFLSGVNQIWKILAKKIPKSVFDSQDRHSMVYVPNGFFVNMEFQNDFNYWDTYWIVRGALICGMNQTVKGIIGNLLHLVQKYGYVLTGNRVYYEGRSNPPLLTQMMATYYMYTNDHAFLVDNIKLLDREMMFWLMHRSVNVKSIGNIYSMAHYLSDTFDPRPEFYSYDVKLARHLNNTRDQDEYLCRVKAASESGWGFSSRHFHNRIHYDDYEKTLLKTNPLNFAYVELNSIMQSNANLLSKMYLLNNDNVNSEFYKQIARRFQIGINALLWNEDENIWLDFDTSTGKNRNYFFASNLAPLWTGSYDNKLSEFYGDAAVDYLIKNNIINSDLTPRFLCIPTSLYDSGLDWDYYNCWPQLQSMVIFGLQSTRSERAKKVAFNFASSWVNTNFVGYNRTKTLFQKYSAIELGSDGEKSPEKGSYPQGYGVTMGLLFEIFHEWGSLLTAKTERNKMNRNFRNRN